MSEHEPTFAFECEQTSYNRYDLICILTMTPLTVKKSIYVYVINLSFHAQDTVKCNFCSLAITYLDFVLFIIVIKYRETKNQQPTK